MKILVLNIFILLLINGCSSQSVLPDIDDLKVSRENPDSKCQHLGKVTGRSLSSKAKAEDALEDMKKDAVQKGANYLVVEQYSGSGTSVSGQAYQCP